MEDEFYVLYRGDEIVTSGSLEHIMSQTGFNLRYLQWLKCKTAFARESRSASENRERMVLVKSDPITSDEFQEQRMIDVRNYRRKTKMIINQFTTKQINAHTTIDRITKALDELNHKQHELQIEYKKSLLTTAD